MIKVLIVDDELLGRIALRTCINWEEHGFVIAGECADGDQAISLIPKLQPQIIITDVKMNRVNGDELVSYVAKNYPEICTIVLSGYDDYEYVRSVFKNNAIDYLIKSNLTAKVLLESLEKAKQILKVGPTIKKNEKNMQILRQQFGLRILSGAYRGKEKEIEDEARALSININFNNIMPILVLINNSNIQNKFGNMQDFMLLDFSIHNILEEIIKEENQGMIIPIQENEFIVLLSFQDISSEKRIENEVNKIVSRSKFCFNKFLSISSNFYIGKRGNLSNLDQNFTDLITKREEDFLDVISDSQEPLESKKEYNNGKGLPLEDELNIIGAVRTRNNEEVKEILDQIFDTLYVEQISRSGCMYLFNNLIILSISICKKYNIPYEKVYTGSEQIIDYVKNLLLLKDCKDFFQGLFEKIFTELDYYDSQKGYSIPIQKAISYINDNYKEQISLTDLSEEIDLNSSYLSSLFKSEVGFGFSEYLNDLRLSKAKELIEHGNLKIKEIAEISGFVSYPYFFRLFKSKYNKTPLEYRKNSEY